MSIVKINAITVPRERFDEFERRFASRAGRVDAAPGFEGFELLRPNDEREVCLVLTRWRSEDDFRPGPRARTSLRVIRSTARRAQSGPRANCGRSTCLSAKRRVRIPDRSVR